MSTPNPGVARNTRARMYAAMVELRRGPLTLRSLAARLGVTYDCIRTVAEHLSESELADSRPADGQGDVWFALDGAPMPEPVTLDRRYRGRHGLRSERSYAALAAVEGGPRTGIEICERWGVVADVRMFRALLDLTITGRLDRSLVARTDGRPGRRTVYSYALTDEGARELARIRAEAA